MIYCLEKWKKGGVKIRHNSNVKAPQGSKSSKRKCEKLTEKKVIYSRGGGVKRPKKPFKSPRARVNSASFSSTCRVARYQMARFP